MKLISMKELDDRILEEVAVAVQQGNVVIFPTETIYGIGTNAFDESAVERIYKIKGRPEQKALIVLINDYQMLELIASITTYIERNLMKKFWPGPLTIIFQKKNISCLPENVTARKDTIAVRMSDNEIIKKLIAKSGVPIVAPSANLSGSSSATKIKEIISDLGEQVDYILDNGDIKDETPSTIVKVENGEIKIYVGFVYNDAYIKVIDTGIGIPEEDIEKVFERFYRVDKARTREMGGTGLGLSIAKEIIEKNRGSIDIKSEVGKGTEVILKIPVTKHKKIQKDR